MLKPIEQQLLALQNQFEEDFNQPIEQQFIIHYPKMMENNNKKQAHKQCKKTKNMQYKRLRNRPQTRDSQKRQKNIKIEDQDEQQQLYKVIPPDLQRITKKCLKIKNNQLHKARQKFIKTLHDLLPSNFNKKFSHFQQLSDESASINQKKSTKTKKIKKHKKVKKYSQQQYQQSLPKQFRKIDDHKLIFALEVPSNQENDIPFFIEEFIRLLQDQYNDNDKDSPNKNNLYKNTSKINIISEAKHKISDIVLSLYYQYEKIHCSDQLTIYCNKIHTNLNHENIYKIHQVLEKCNCILIIPTNHSFRGFINYQSNLEIIPLSMYDHRQLFCSFMFECVLEPQIKSYLPSQSLGLIEEFDNFSLTYHEGCRRLIFLIRQFHIFAYQKGITIQLCQCRNLFDVLNKSFAKRFSLFVFDRDSQQNCEAYLYCMLDQQCKFILPQNLLCLWQFYQTSDDFQEKRNKDSHIAKFRERLHARFNFQPQLKKYLTLLQQDIKKTPTYKEFFKTCDKDSQENQIKKKKTKNSKSNKKANKINERNKASQLYYKQLLEQNSFNVNFESQEQLLNTQLTIIIKQHTKIIRQYSSKWFQWSSYNYIQRIKPMVIKDMHNLLLQSPKLGYIYKKCLQLKIFRLSDLYWILSINIHQNGEISDIQNGKLMFILKQLMLYGMITMKQTQIDPILWAEYYPKASYFNQVKKTERKL